MPAKKKTRTNPRRQSLREKFILYGLITFAPIFFVFTLFVLLHSSAEKINEIKTTSVSGARSVSISTELVQDEIKKISTYISLNNDIMKILESDDVEKLNANPRLWYDEASFETLQNLVSLNGNIRSFAVYPENGVQPYLRGMDGSVNHSTIERIRASKEYSFTKNKKYGMYWCPVQKDTRSTFSVNRHDKIVFYRELMDFTRTTPLCFIAIGINRDSFEDICQNAMTSPNEGYLIFNQEGELLCDTGFSPDEIKNFVQRRIQQAGWEKDVESFFFKGNYITCCNISGDSSIVCNIIPSSTFTNFVKKMVFVVFGAFTLMILFLLVLLFLMYRFINLPLMELTEGISKLSDGDFSQRIKVSSNDEIGDVARAFNKMIEDINSLINENYIIKMKEKENELASLQAQINPHFLYNTLNSLYWQALNQDNEELADNIFSLSRLFQLVLSRGKQEIFVENEFELIEHYLEVQKMRFNSKLQYSIELDDKIRREKFSKLLLQPFVENSIEHGFSNKTSECNLFIRGYLKDNNMIFEIKDSGTGMSEEEIHKLFSTDTKVGHDRVGGYAIKNIIDRIKLLYGERGSVRIESEIDIGTSVTITVPFKGEIYGK